MIVPLSPTESDTLTALRSFLLAVLPSGVPVVKAQANRVPEPQPGDFVVMTPTTRLRIETNIDNYVDCAFTGSIAGNVLTVTQVAFGALAVGSPVYGTGVVTGLQVQALAGGTGGVGTYTLTAVASAALQPMAAGVLNALQPIDLTVQLDVHGPNAADNAQIITTLMRDDYACEFFAALETPQNSVAPLYADDPKQIPFINDQQQYEWRWVVEARLQVNQVVTVGQQFAEKADVGLIDVDAVYPP